MDKDKPSVSRGGFALISIILILILVGILASLQLTKHFNTDDKKDKTSGSSTSDDAMMALKSKTVTDEARDIAGKAALDAASSNVRVAYTKLLMSSTSQAAVSTEAVVKLLNGRYTRVGDYVVSYSASGTDRVTITLQAVSKGQFGTPDSQEVSLIKRISMEK